MSQTKYINKGTRCTVKGCDHFSQCDTITYHRFPVNRDGLVYYLTLIRTLFNILFKKMNNLNLIILL